MRLICYRPHSWKNYEEKAFGTKDTIRDDTIYYKRNDAKLTREELYWEVWVSKKLMTSYANDVVTFLLFKSIELRLIWCISVYKIEANLYKSYVRGRTWVFNGILGYEKKLNYYGAIHSTLEQYQLFFSQHRSSGFIDYVRNFYDLVLRRKLFNVICLTVDRRCLLLLDVGFYRRICIKILKSLKNRHR